MAYQPIENYGVIGDMRSVALVGMNGSIDWMCFPRFDSPSVFGAILDDAKGGRFRIAPRVENFTTKQFYWPDTNVLVTRFLSPEGVGEITDFMPVSLRAGNGDSPRLIRRVGVVRGSMSFGLECVPAFNYARDAHQLEINPGGVSFRSAGASMRLDTGVALQRSGSGVRAEFTLGEGQMSTFAFRKLPAGGDGHPVSDGEANELFEQTVDYWRRWIAHCTYAGRWREMVCRSALVLKLLTYEPSGAIVAAPTCSLPEALGGIRNWDYRYTWIRDAAFTIYALMRIGITEEAGKFMGWLEQRCAHLGPSDSLLVMYGIDGHEDLKEEELPHLEGYRGSRPVRIGNGAHDQLQLDIVGELMDSAYLFNKYGRAISYDMWRALRQLVNWVADNWQMHDKGIWEMRGGSRPYVYSKMMCWVALDRGLRLADKRSFPADRIRWLELRDKIYEEILSKGWNPERRAFVQYYGAGALDAANLIMPLVFFVSPNDPRMLNTLDAICQPPDRGGLLSDSLVYRYLVGETDDGLGSNEGSFNMCTFWLVEALTRAGRAEPRRLREARLLFEKMIGYANHLGLYSEETGPCGEALGNFPQAFTHLALISAAYNLDRALGSHR